jgi:hypothetical protein
MTAEDNLSIFNVDPKNPKLKQLRNTLIESNKGNSFAHYGIVCPFAYASIEWETGEKFVLSKHFTNYACKFWTSNTNLVNCWDILKKDSSEWKYEESLRKRCQIKYNWKTSKWSWWVKKYPGEVFKIDIRKIAPRIHCLECNETNKYNIRGYPLSMWFPNKNIEVEIKNKLMMCDKCIKRKTTLIYHQGRYNYHLRRVFARNHHPPGTTYYGDIYSDNEIESDDEINDKFGHNIRRIGATGCVPVTDRFIEDDELRIFKTLIEEECKQLKAYIFMAELKIPFDYQINISEEANTDDLYSGSRHHTTPPHGTALRLQITGITNKNILYHIATWKRDWTMIMAK